MAIIRLSGPLYKQTNGQKKLTIKGETILEILKDLIKNYPSLQRYCLDVNNELQPFVSYHLNNKDIKSLNGITTKVNDDDILTIIPALAGG